ncbi:MAG: hypothetical protein J5636_03375, partial [Clostridiales bacterium]|nr:hypothetical protein [Clostridiales bacterium]
MKKKLAAVMAVVMIVGLSGCSILGGSKFKKTSDKIVKAAESACDAQEADKKQKKKLLKFDPTDEVFEEGAYLKLSSDDLEDIDFSMGDAELDPDDIKNATLFAKNEDGSMLVAVVIEAGDEGTAEDLYDAFMESTEDMDEKSLKKLAKNADLEYGIDDEDDNKYVMMMVYEDYGMASGMYYQRDGKVITAVIYSGSPEADLLEEFYAFMNDAKLTDME